MIPLDAVSYPILPRVAVIGAVYAASLGAVLALKLALTGRPTYWLGVAGGGLVIFGVLLSSDFFPGGVTVIAIGGGIALGIFAVALDLLFLPPAGTGQGSSPAAGTGPRSG